MLEIDYIPGTHTPPNVLAFDGAVKQLCKIHNESMVHGDIRDVNIVFDGTGSSHIIDFDLAKKENDIYPAGYVTTHFERHQEARPGKRMLKIHDKHALFCIICRYFPKKSTLNLVQKEIDTWINLLSSSS